MDAAQFFVSMLGGGLAGGCVSIFANRLFHRRALRTQFEPRLSDIFSVYVIRMEDPNRRYMVSRPDRVPSPLEAEFVNHRSNFILNLVEFNELKEAQSLRRKFIENTGVVDGDTFRTDLLPERQAISDCLGKVQKKLKLS